MSGGGHAAERIGAFRVLEPLRGGMGTQGSVCRAVCEETTHLDVRPGEIVALKTMSVADDDGKFFAKLRRRTGILASLNHPNVVRYRGCFAVADALTSLQVVVMDCLEGETLKDRLAANPGGLDADEALGIVEKAAAGLEAAGIAGLVHRDVKPSNIFLCRDGSVKLIDFELALSGASTTASHGRFLGTFDYMAPEFADANFRGDETSDVFSLGVVLHESLCGRTPYADGKANGRQADFDFLSRWSEGADLRRSLQPSARATRLLSGMKEVLAKAISPSRSARFATFAEFRTALGHVCFREFRNGERHYRLLKQIGKGGFGEVFKARMTPGDRMVAVKHLMKAAYGDRFRREARLMQRFHDPCFTQFIDYFETSRAGSLEAYLVMDYLPDMPGSSLRDAIRAAAPGRLKPTEVIAAFVRYAHGLSVLHAGRVYHRDIKPSNLYYPAGRSADAVIMDMGIARDAGGSVTAGDVPGTLDYMPPEIVTSGNRGDARMDIYALGLCFYEALTGRQGFPRLPSGSDGLREFYSRSCRALMPTFDDSEIVRRPAVLALLRRMTDPDVTQRLGDAAELERLIRSLDWNAPLAPAAPTVCAAAEPNRPQPRRVADPQTMATSATGRRRSPFGTFVPFALKWAVRGVAAAVVAGVLALAAVFLREPLVVTVEKFRNWQIERRVAEERSVAEARAAAAAAAADRAERATNAKEADVEAAAVVSAYDRALTTEPGDAGMAEWKAKWSRRSLPGGWLDERTEALSAARENCRARMNDRRIIADRESDAIFSDYLNAADVAVPDARAVAWTAKWATNGIPVDAFVRKTNEFAQAHMRCADRIRRRAKRADEAALRRKNAATRMAAAREEAERLVADYARKDVLKAKVDSAYALWCGRWGELAANADFKQLDQRIRKGQEERRRTDLETTVVAECRALFANIWTMTSENVRNWRDYLDRAVIEMKKASRAGRLSEAGRAALECEIAAMRRWHVGVVDNKTHETLSFMGRRIDPVSEALFVLTNGVPDHAAITCGGYEPLRVTAARFDAHTFVVMKQDLVRANGSSELEIPQLADGVVCLVDGRLCESGCVRLPSGKHDCIYRKTCETTPGVRDYLDQVRVVTTTGGKLTRLPPPTEWTVNPDGQVARENAARSSRGESLAASIEKAFETLPLETRRARLEKVFSALSNWQTPSLLGKRTMDRLKERYERERMRTVGCVVNGLEVPLRVKVQERWVAVAPGESAVVSFDDGNTADARIAVIGYDYLYLPAPSAFDGRDFTVTSEMLVPTPVMVTVPDLGEGVECRLAGELVRETVERKPGRYICVYSRSGFADQRQTVEVKVGEDMTLPLPGKWEPVGVFGRLVDTVKDVTDSTARGFRSATETISTIERKKE